MSLFLSSDDIALYKSPLGGDGVRASTSLPAGRRVLLEKPLVAMQTVVTKNDVLVCANCLTFVGGADLQLRVLARRVTRVSILEGQEFPGVSPCAHRCGEVYCSATCLSEHWVAGGHQLLCTGCY
jgi:hypothetical protein